MDIATLLGSYAFPIVACLGMAWYVKYITDETAKLNEEHTTIMLAYKDELKDAINNNTIVMQKLCDSMSFPMPAKNIRKEDTNNET